MSATTRPKAGVHECRWRLLGAGSSNGGNRARRSRRTARRRLGNRASKRWFPAPRRYVRSPWGQRSALNREPRRIRSEEHTSGTPVTNAHLVCRLLLEKKNKTHKSI